MSYYCFRCGQYHPYSNLDACSYHIETSTPPQLEYQYDHSKKLDEITRLLKEIRLGLKHGLWPLDDED